MCSLMEKKEAVLIVAHGSRVEATDLIMKSYEKALNEKSEGLLFDYCYLQIMKPGMEEAVERLYEKGIRHLKVFPFFIFNGHHIQHDIPEEIERLKLKYEGLTMTFLENVGYDDKMTDLIMERTTS